MPVIVLTASGLPIPSHARHAFRKPFDFEEFLTVLEQVLATRA